MNTGRSLSKLGRRIRYDIESEVPFTSTPSRDEDCRPPSVAREVLGCRATMSLTTLSTTFCLIALEMLSSVHKSGFLHYSMNIGMSFEGDRESLSLRAAAG